MSHRFRFPALVCAVLLGGILAPGAVEAAGGFIPAKPVYSSSGLALVVYEGGSIDELEGATRSAGAIGVWAQDKRGEFHVLPVGAPAFLKKHLGTAFPTSGAAKNFPSVQSVTLVAPD